MSSQTSLNVNPDQLERELRLWFTYFLVHSRRFKPVNLAMEKKWGEAVSVHRGLRTVPAFADLPAVEDPADPLNVYIAAVRFAVAKEFRCRINGAPVDWLCQALHGSVRGESMDTPREIVYRQWVGEVIVWTTTGGTALVGTRLNGMGVGTPVEFDVELRRPFSAWDKLRKAGRHQLDGLIARMRTEMEDATIEYRRMYAKGYQTKTQETTQKLVAWLVDREEQFDSDRTTTNLLLHELNFDPPVLSRKLDE